MVTVGHTLSVTSSFEARIARVFAAFLLPSTGALLSYAALAQGAFFWPQLSFLASALVVLGMAASDRRDDAVRPVGAALAALGAALVASGIANGWTEAARVPLATLVVAGGAFVAVRGLLARGERDAYLEILAWLGSAVALIGCVSLAYHFGPWATRAQGIWRLASTLTYVNAAAAVLTLCLPAAVLLVARRARAGRLAVFLIATGLVVTLSRGGAIGAVLMIVVSLSLGARPLVRPLLRPLAGSAIAVGALLPSITSSDGNPAVAFAGLLAGSALAVTGNGVTRPRARTVAIAVAIPIVLVPILFLAQGGRDLLDARASAASEDRLRTWGATWDSAVEHPVFGTGPGTFALVERVGRGRAFTRFAHNEYLQAFAETGAAGALAIVVAIAVCARTAWRRRPRAGTDERALWAVAVGACAASAAHAGFDFIWHVPVIVMVTFGWLALAITRGSTSEG